MPRELWRQIKHDANGTGQVPGGSNSLSTKPRPSAYKIGRRMWESATRGRVFTSRATVPSLSKTWATQTHCSVCYLMLLHLALSFQREDQLCTSGPSCGVGTDEPSGSWFWVVKFQLTFHSISSCDKVNWRLHIIPQKSLLKGQHSWNNFHQRCHWLVLYFQWQHLPK